MSYVSEDLATLRIPLEDILIATNNFSEENILKRGRHACAYRGFLSRWCEVDVGIDVVARAYLSYRSKFYEEIETISFLNHKNVVSLIGFCDEIGKGIIVMEHAVNGSLEKYLSDPILLTWSQRLHICFGAALALNYRHNNYTTHFYIKGSFKILLDKNWEAKVLFSIDSYTEDSDVYCLGVILLEVLYGRKATNQDVYMYIDSFEDGKHVDDMIDPNLRAQMHSQSLSIFSETAYECFKSNESSDILQIMERLKEAFEIQWKHENHLRVENFASLKIPLRQIKSATYNFDYTCRIKSLSNDKVYKGELAHFETESVSKIEEGQNKGELPKKSVIIKRFMDQPNYPKITKDLFEELEMLSSCTHPNLLTLLGFCDEDDEKILVFECDYKETLDDYLRSASNRTNLTWERRIRIGLDIAHGLKYLHDIEETQVMHSIHVFLDEKWTAKIANFRLSKFCSYEAWLWHAMDIAPWIPPCKRRILDDVYSLGVTLFDILTGRLVYDPQYVPKNVNDFASMVRQHFNDGELKNIADHRIMEETQECSYTLKKGPNQDSFDTFTKIAYQCLAETPSERPTLEFVIKSLEKALHFQVQNLDHLKIAFKDIELATENFDEKYCIGSGGYGKVYKCSLAIKVKSKDEHPEMSKSIVAIKRIFNREDGQGKEGFLAEIDVLSRCEHPNIISLLGFCVENNEMLLVYEHAPKKSLDGYLGSTNKANLTWTQRMKMCIDIANGLNYLHLNMGDKKGIIHRDIKSDNILLGENWEAKIADFGLSKVHHGSQDKSTIKTKNIAGTNKYLDPEYARTGKLKKASDIYSFGVVLFEIFSGKLAYDQNYISENENGLAPIAREHFEKGTLKEILDPKIRDEAHELISTLIVGPSLESLNAFSKIAYRCLAITQAKRPKIEEVIKELKEALKLHENRKDAFKFSLEDINLGVRNFRDDYCLTEGHRVLYRGEVQYVNGHKKVLVKRFHRSCHEHGFLREYEVLFKHKHENITGLVGYCKEQDEKIIVYEHASNGCLSRYLNDTSFSWNTRLKVCIDIAKGLKFLHGGGVGRDVVIHRDIKSSNILLTKDWKAKICGFELSLTYPRNQKTELSTSDVVGSPGYCDPLYWKTHTLTKESDIYSFGVLLFEILCGRSACPEEFTDDCQFLDVLVKRHFEEEPLEEILFEGIREQIVLKSLFAFQEIAFQCLHEEKEERPTASEVVAELQQALEFQEASEIWETKLPRNYKEILHLSKDSKINSDTTTKEIYNILSKGILLNDDNLWFSIDDNGDSVEMISARKFSFKNRWSHRWRSIQESRFPKVAEMLDIRNLNIQIKIRSQLLPSNINYSVHLVFKFCGPRKSHAKRMYVNLKYKMGSENLNAYFATWREDNWMMIELCRFSNHKKDTNFEVLLEGFSRCYCDSRAIYIEGIEFRAIDNVEQENTEKLKEVKRVLKSPAKFKIKKHKTLWYPLCEIKRKVYHKEYEEGVEYNFSSVTLSNSKSSANSRADWLYKVPRRSMFCINWYIDKCPMVSPNTECACYLVFKLSENCQGLHCPIIVRDHVQRKSKQIIYFRSPSPWNLHDTDRVPKKRRDGWMEVIVSKFNSDFALEEGCLYQDLKLISYEGTMSGLIIRGLEFRPT